MRDFQATRGATFGPVTFALSPAADLAGAFVRLSVSGIGMRDSIVGDGEVVVNDAADTVTWTMPMEATAALDQQVYQYELILVDASGQQRIPAGDGTGRLTMRARASAPV